MRWLHFGFNSSLQTIYHINTSYNCRHLSARGELAAFLCTYTYATKTVERTILSANSWLSITAERWPNVAQKRARQKWVHLVHSTKFIRNACEKTIAAVLSSKIDFVTSFQQSIECVELTTLHKNARIISINLWRDIEVHKRRAHTCGWKKLSQLTWASKSTGDPPIATRTTQKRQVAQINRRIQLSL